MTMRLIWKNLEEINKRIRKSGRIFLALDYDGTLTPIVSRPSRAVMRYPARALLSRLSNKKNISLAVISGRRLSDIEKMVKVKGIFYAGSHGFEIKGPGIKFIHPACLAARPYIRQIKSRLKHELPSVGGIILEDKGVGLSLHYRNVKKTAVDGVKKVFHNIVDGYAAGKKVRLSFGKKVLEVRPNIKWDKFSALNEISKAARKSAKAGKRHVTIYIGDDATDEDVFKKMKAPDISVYVGKKSYKSRAEFFVSNVNDVLKLIGFLEKNYG